MDMADIGIVAALEWIHNKVEERFGKLAAWLVTLAFGGLTIALIVAIIIYLFR